MDFDINAYLNCLPEDIEYIDLRFCNLTFIPSLKRFKNLQILDCDNNKLTSLPLLNENLEELYCNDNCLTSLPSLNENLQILNCSENQLTSLPSLNENLYALYCNNNELTSLPSLNENLRELYCNHNKLTSLPYLNENLQKLICLHNPIDEIIHGMELEMVGLFRIETTIIDVCKKQIQIINNFRHLYWCLRFKNQFKKWLLLVRVR